MTSDETLYIALAVVLVIIVLSFVWYRYHKTSTTSSFQGPVRVQQSSFPPGNLPNFREQDSDQIGITGGLPPHQLMSSNVSPRDNAHVFRGEAMEEIRNQVLLGHDLSGAAEYDKAVNFSGSGLAHGSGYDAQFDLAYTEATGGNFNAHSAAGIHHLMDLGDEGSEVAKYKKMLAVSKAALDSAQSQVQSASQSAVPGSHQHVKLQGAAKAIQHAKLATSSAGSVSTSSA